MIAPLVLPVIKQVKNELATGSSEIIESSRQQQHIVFHDHRCSDPTHSMLSKDHFSNILNEPAGKTASQVLKWVVPQIMEAWDDERADINRILTRIITGVFHHPAQRQYGEDGASDGRRGMFQVVEQWWNEKSEREKNGLRDQLSRDGVEQGRNHKPGVKDSGHGCGKPIGMPTMKTATSSGAIGGVPVGNIIGEINSALSGQSQYDSGGSRPSQGGSSEFGKLAGDAVGGGALGGIVGGLAGAIGGDLLGDAFGGQKKSSKRESYGDDGSYTQTYNQRGYGQSEGGQQYGQAQYSQTNYPGGGQREEYRREERTSGGYGSSTYESKTETSYGTSSYQRTTESRYGEGERSQGDGSQSYGQTYGETEVNSEEEKKRKKKEKKEKKKQKKYKKRDSEDDEDNEGDDDDEDEEEEDSDDNRKKRQGGSRRQEETYGQESYGGRSSGYGQETYGGSSGYGEERREEGYGGDSGGYGGRNNDNDDNDGGYGRRGGDDDDNGNRGYQERRGYGNDY